MDAEAFLADCDGTRNSPTAAHKRRDPPRCARIVSVASRADVRGVSPAPNSPRVDLPMKIAPAFSAGQQQPSRFRMMVAQNRTEPIAVVGMSLASAWSCSFMIRGLMKVRPDRSCVRGQARSASPAPSGYRSRDDRVDLQARRSWPHPRQEIELDGDDEPSVRLLRRPHECRRS